MLVVWYNMRSVPDGASPSTALVSAGLHVCCVVLLAARV
jgi:hypothetical protein